jgi:hypothetical protein
MEDLAMIDASDEKRLTIVSNYNGDFSRPECEV